MGVRGPAGDLPPLCFSTPIDTFVSVAPAVGGHEGEDEGRLWEL